MTMTIELPDLGLENFKLTPEQARVELAVGLYAGRHLTMGRAAQIAGMPKLLFMQEIGRRGICINYTLEDLRQDIETVRQRLGQ